MNRFLIAVVMICSVRAAALSQSVSLAAIPSNAAATNQPQRNAISQAAEVPEFIIGPEDVLVITVWHEPDLSVTVRVRPDGKISYPLLADIQASGLTPSELQKQITARLDHLVNDPTVSVVVQEIHSQVVHVIGSVARAGAYDLRSPTTVIQLLARAGGLAETADRKDIVIVRKGDRKDDSKVRRFRFDYDLYANGQNLKQNILLHSGDVIIVP